jgi:inward rectifier potassium channel
MVASVEIVCGLAFTAILTGLTFVRFSRPRAKLVFAANPVVAMHNGKPTLMVRIGNGRAAVLADAKAQLNVLLTETTTEGKVFHRAQELQLERAHTPFFPLFWTLMHVLDERSPLNGYDAARAVKANTQVFVAIGARDPTLATTVHDIRNYPVSPSRVAKSRSAVGERCFTRATVRNPGQKPAEPARLGRSTPPKQKRGIACECPLRLSAGWAFCRKTPCSQARRRRHPGNAKFAIAG